MSLYLVFFVGSPSFLSIIVFTLFSYIQTKYGFFLYLPSLSFFDYTFPLKLSVCRLKNKNLVLTLSNRL